MFNLTLTRKPSLWGRELYFHPDDVRFCFSPSPPVVGNFFSYLLLTANTSWISSTTSLKEDLTFSSFSKSKAGIFKASDNSEFEWYKFFSPSSPILRLKFWDKWKKQPDVVALGSAFPKALIAASSKSIKTLSRAALGRSDNKISRKRLICAFCFVW